MLEMLRDVGWIPGLRRSPGEGSGTLLSILAWKIPWAEEPGGLLSMGHKESRHDWATEHTYIFYLENGPAHILCSGDTVNGTHSLTTLTSADKYASDLPNVSHLMGMHIIKREIQGCEETGVVLSWIKLSLIPTR